MFQSEVTEGCHAPVMLRSTGDWRKYCLVGGQWRILEGIAWGGAVVFRGGSGLLLGGDFLNETVGFKSSTCECS